MRFRYFDAEDREMTFQQLHAMRITTPAIEHVMASVAERLGKIEKQAKEIENGTSERYN